MKLTAHNTNHQTNEFVSALRNRPLGSVLFYHQNGIFTCQNLFDLSEQFGEQLKHLAGKNIVIKGESRLNGAILALLLEQYANQILFLPTDIADELHSLYLTQAKIDYEVKLIDGKLVYFPVASGNQTPNAVMDTHQNGWIIPTSGTTGIPKLIHHSLASLTKSTKKDTNIGKNYVWGLVYDIYRFAGMQVFLQAVLGGASLIIGESDDDMLQLVERFKKYDCNALSATPSFWRKLLMCPNITTLNLKTITLGGEIVDDVILNQLRQVFPNAKITHIYASTELGVGFSVQDGKAGFPLLYLNQTNLGLSINADNILCIADDNGEPISTGDMVEIKGERVYFLGRETGTINVGGNKVLPEEIENCVIQLNFVQAVKVYGKKSSFLGNVVCADVVLDTAIGESLPLDKIKNDILSHCRNHLTAFKVPAKINIVPEIELTVSGKIKR